jgi:hypothetical protein
MRCWSPDVCQADVQVFSYFCPEHTGCPKAPVVAAPAEPAEVAVAGVGEPAGS